jgi:hypothetical protein
MAQDPNDQVVVGALWALFGKSDTAITSVTLPGEKEGMEPNQLEITLRFMRSPYRITVERVVDPFEEEQPPYGPDDAEVADILHRLSERTDWVVLVEEAQPSHECIDYRRRRVARESWKPVKF